MNSKNDLSEYCQEAIMDDDGNELVTENSACPSCNERRMDWLEWVSDEEVKCGQVYEP